MGTYTLGTFQLSNKITRYTNFCANAALHERNLPNAHPRRRHRRRRRNAMALWLHALPNHARGRQQPRLQGLSHVLLLQLGSGAVHVVLHQRDKGTVSRGNGDM